MGAGLAGHLLSSPIESFDSLSASSLELLQRMDRGMDFVVPSLSSPLRHQNSPIYYRGAQKQCKRIEKSGSGGLPIRSPSAIHGKILAQISELRTIIFAQLCTWTSGLLKPFGG